VSFDAPELARRYAQQPQGASLVPSSVLGTNDNSTLVSAHRDHWVMLTNSSVKGARNCIDVSSKELARYWCKRFKKTKPEIEAAIAKVGNNAETVMKELRRSKQLVLPK
jgi:Protein of unknown function (DUF3606)